MLTARGGRWQPPPDEQSDLGQTGLVHLRPVGRHALLVEVDDAAAARSLAAWAREQGVPAEEVVPAATTVLFDGVARPVALRERLASWQPGGASADLGLIEIEVTYDGPDLGFVAAEWGIDERDVAEAHAEVEYVAAFCGFAPGFAYLEGLPEERAVPRLDSPRSKVPAGAVALAGTWSAVYPSASPGGWRIIGSTDAVLWDASRDEPALLPPGTRVRFVPR
jgi:KipI family sensor histidine kinase inhibitor